jgi:hypothetical protein
MGYTRVYLIAIQCIYIYLNFFFFLIQKLNVSQLIYASLPIAVNEAYTYMYIRQGRLNSSIYVYQTGPP